MNAMNRAKLADDLVRRLAAAIRGAQLYAPGHPIVIRSVTALAESLSLVYASTRSLAIGIVGDDLVVGEIPVARAAENMGELMRRLQQAGVERIVLDRGVEVSEITRLVHALASADAAQLASLTDLAHIRVGRLQVERRVDAPSGDVATFQRLYDDAVSVAGRIWDDAENRNGARVAVIRGTIIGCASAMATSASDRA